MEMYEYDDPPESACHLSDPHNGAPVLPKPSGPLFQTRYGVLYAVLVLGPGTRTSIGSSRYNLHIPVWPAGNIEVPREMQGEAPVAAVMSCNHQ